MLYSNHDEKRYGFGGADSPASTPENREYTTTLSLDIMVDAISNVYTETVANNSEILFKPNTFNDLERTVGTITDIIETTLKNKFMN